MSMSPLASHSFLVDAMNSIPFHGRFGWSPFFLRPWTLKSCFLGVRSMTPGAMDGSDERQVSILHMLLKTIITVCGRGDGFLL
jgi:hypothetical protein